MRNTFLIIVLISLLLSGCGVSGSQKQFQPLEISKTFVAESVQKTLTHLDIKTSPATPVPPLLASYSSISSTPPPTIISVTVINATTIVVTLSKAQAGLTTADFTVSYAGGTLNAVLAVLANEGNTTYTLTLSVGLAENEYVVVTAVGTTLAASNANARYIITAPPYHYYYGYTINPISGPLASPGVVINSVSAINNIIGTAQVGVELTAGSLTPAGATASYQWKISTDGTTYADITGATTNKYTPVVGDVGKFIKVSATGTGSYTGSATSAATAAVKEAEAVLVAKYTNAADAAAVTALLEASPNALGLTLTDYAVLDATGKSDVAADLFAARAGLTTKALIQTAVTTAIATAKGESGVRAEAAKITVTALGTIKVGDTDTILHKARDLVGTGYTVSVKAADGTYISAAGEATLAGPGTISFTVVQTGTPANTADTAALPINVLPNTTPVTAIAISGTPQVGVVLTASGLMPAGATVNYQWKSCATVDGTYADISGSTASTYTPNTNYVGKFLKLAVTGTGSYSGTATSAATSAVADGTAKAQADKITALTLGTIPIGTTVISIAQPLIDAGFTVAMSSMEASCGVSVFGSNGETWKPGTFTNSSLRVYETSGSAYNSYTISPTITVTGSRSATIGTMTGTLKVGTSWSAKWPVTTAGMIGGTQPVVNTVYWYADAAKTPTTPANKEGFPNLSITGIGNDGTTLLQQAGTGPSTAGTYYFTVKFKITDTCGDDIVESNVMPAVVAP